MVILELDGLDVPHEVPVVETMTVVIAKHAAIVFRVKKMVDESEIVADYGA